MSAIDKFQNDAKHISSTLNVSGRFSFQEEAMKLVVGDIVQKLKIKPTDELLDIGCNCGDLTIPLSFFGKNVTGIDGKSTNIGRKIDLEYNQKMNCLTEEDKKSHAYSKEMDGLWILDDEYLMKLLLEVRNHGYESYLLPQKHELPFGYTRDDILICAWD